MHDDGRARFAEQLAERRSRAGLSLADVATAAHVARGYVHHIEHGRRWPTQRVARALDAALDAEGTLGRHADAVPLLSTALEGLPDCYERDRARYAAQLALALAGAGDAERALAVAMRAAKLTAATGSALATRELRRVRAAMRERGAKAQAGALAEHVQARTDVLGRVPSSILQALDTPCAGRHRCKSPA